MKSIHFAANCTGYAEEVIRHVIHSIHHIKDSTIQQKSHKNTKQP